METNNNEGTEKKGILYIVSTPIGNWDDITLRAIKILKNCDKIICEEGKEGAKILKQYNIHKEIELLNEHNEDERTLQLIYSIEQGKRYALISDCGTPVFADPGFALVKAAIGKDIEISVIPGASSLMAGIVRSGLTITQFLFAGFLSRIKEERLSQLHELSKEKRTVALLETPYRMMPFLEAAKDVMPYRKAYIGCNLTMPFETHHYGTFSELYERFSEKKFKGEFIVVFEGLPGDGSISREWDIENEKRRESNFNKSEDDYRKKDRFDEGRREKGEWRKDIRRNDRRSSSRDSRGRSDERRSSTSSGRYKSDGRGSSSGDNRGKSDDRRGSSGAGRFKADDRRSSSGGGRFKSDDRRDEGRRDKGEWSKDSRKDDGRSRQKTEEGRQGENKKRQFKSDDRRSSSGDRRSSSGDRRRSPDDRRGSSGDRRGRTDDRRGSSGDRRGRTDDRRGSSGVRKFKSDEKRNKPNDKPGKKDGE
ncbi:MAG: 16S rRNA (cytidine(1402)-2'-O)-methyltransferase [bacterium]